MLDPPGVHPASTSPLLSEEPLCFHNSLVHLYRGEMQRMTTWRSRLDATAHWAILLTTGMTTFTLGSVAIPHYILLLGLAISVIFMTIEARRYQHLHHSKWRIHLMEQGYFGRLLCPEFTLGNVSWRQQLGTDLEQPHFTIGLFMALRMRLRRNYLMLFYFTTAVWLTKIFIHPSSPQGLKEFYQRLAVGELFPCWFVLLTATFFVLSATTLALTTPSEEKLEHWTALSHAAHSQKQQQRHTHQGMEKP
jgi:uncharacterized membrane protein